MSNATEQVKADAVEFGRHVKQGGWRLGLLVARNVEVDKGHGRPPKSGKLHSRAVFEKVSVAEFARLSGVSRPKVMRYLDAWEAAAHLGHVPHADELTPDAEPDLDLEELPAWGDFYKTDPRNTSRAQYHTRTVLKDPEQRRQVIASLDDDEREAIVDTAIEVTAQEARAVSAEHRTDPALGDIGGVGAFTDRTAFEIDVPLVKAWRLVRQVARTIHENGLWIGEDRYDEMIERATELETAASEIRAAIQEARNEKSLA